MSERDRVTVNEIAIRVIVKSNVREKELEVYFNDRFSSCTRVKRISLTSWVIIALGGAFHA